MNLYRYYLVLIKREEYSDLCRTFIDLHCFANSILLNFKSNWKQGYVPRHWDYHYQESDPNFINPFLQSIVSSRNRNWNRIMGLHISIKAERGLEFTNRTIQTISRLLRIVNKDWQLHRFHMYFSYIICLFACMTSWLYDPIGL